MRRENTEIVQDKKEETDKQSKVRQFLALMPCILLSLCYGTNSAFVSLLTPQLREDCSEFPITEDQESWIVSLDNLFTPVVCILSGPIQHMIGPRSSIQLACLPYIAAWIITIFASDYKLIYIARLLVGISHALSTTTIYSAEILTNEQRGPFEIAVASFRAVGSTTVFAFGLLFRWTTISQIMLGVPVLALLLTFLIPESPVYLISKQKEEKAERSMRRLYGNEFDTEQKTKKIKKNLETISVRQGGKKLNYIKNINQHPEVYKPFLIIMVLGIAQMCSGASVLRGYVIKIFDSIFATNNIQDSSEYADLENSTLTDGDDECIKQNQVQTWAYISGIIIGFFRFAGSVFLATKLKAHKRRSMYKVSIISSILGLLLFSLFSFLKDHNSENVYGWLSLAAACFIVTTVQLGVQNLPFLYSGELFPADIRVICKSSTRAFTTLMLLGILKLFPLFVDSMTLAGTFLLYGCILTVLCPILYFIVPETKGVELEKMHRFFRKATVNENQRPNLDELEEGAKARHDMNANTTKDAHDNLAYESNSEDGYNTFITVQ